jgi:hypothetical protein
MSVMARVRTVSEGLYGKIVAHPEIATRLARERETCDFERASYLAKWEYSAGRNADRRAKAVQRGEMPADGLEKQHAVVWVELIALGIRHADVDVALELGRAGLGLSWAFADTVAASLFHDGGIAVGDDVGYGLSRMFSPN